jgi:hypothetical protein
MLLPRFLRVNRMRFARLFLITCALLAAAAGAHGQVTLDPLPVPAFGGGVTATERVGDMLFVAGSFLGASPPADARGGLSIHDTSTGTRAQDTVYVTGDVLATMPDGAGGYYIAGNFRIVNGVYRPWLARIRGDGSLDPTFFPIVTGLLDVGRVQALARSGNTLFIGGDFDAVHGQPRSNLAAVDATTGALLPFSPLLDQVVDKLAVEGGALYVAGLFRAVSGQPRSGLASFDATTGALLPWAPSIPSSSVQDFEIVGTAMFVATGNGVQKVDITSGAALPILTPGFFVPQVLEIEVINDTTVVVGGTFTLVNGSQRVHLAAFNPLTGAPYPWAPNPTEHIQTMDVIGTTLYVGGGFTRISGEVRAGAAAFDWSTGSGTLLPWNPSMNGVVKVIAGDSGRVVLGGEFTAPNATVRRAIAQVDLTTRQLTPWQSPNVLGGVGTMAVANGRVFIAGELLLMLSGIVPIETRYLVVLDAADGGEILAWPMPDGPVGIIEATADAVYIVGSFERVGGQSRNGIAAYTLDGTLTPFNPVLPATVYTLEADATRVYLGGGFFIGGALQGLLTYDRSTSAVVPGVTVLGSVHDLALDGGTLYLGGLFTSVAGVSRVNLAAVALATGTTTAWNPGAVYVYPTRVMGIGGGRLVASGLTPFPIGPLTTFAIVDTAGPVLGSAALDGPIHDIELVDTRLILAGGFDYTTSTPTPGLAMFTVGTASVPGAPQNLQASVSGNRVTFTWTAPSVGTAVVGYVLEAGLAPGATAISVPLPNATSFSATAPDGVFFVRVRAVGAAGAGAPSNEVQITIPSCSSLQAPSPLTGSVAGSVVSLAWQAVVGAATYVIDAGTSAGASDVGSFPVGTATSVSTAAPPGTYFVRVRAAGGCGSSPPTNEVMLTVAGPTLPSAPTNLQATVSGSTVTLSWQPPVTGAPITTYILEVGQSPATPTNLLVAPLGPGLSFSANAPSGTYFVRMRAQNGAGVGPPGEQITVVVP